MYKEAAPPLTGQAHVGTSLNLSDSRFLVRKRRLTAAPPLG